MSQKRNDEESMICLMPTPNQSFFVYHIQSKENFSQKKSFLRKGGSGGLNRKQKDIFLTVLVTVIKKDHTMLIIKHANELKVHEKTVRTAVKQDLNPGLNPLDYVIQDFLENKQMQLPIQILVRLRLLLRRNGIKCL